MSKIQAIYKIMGRLSKREKLVLYSTVLFVSIALSDRLIIGPIFYKVKSLNEEIRKRETDIKNSLRVLSHKDQIITEKTKYASFLTGFKSEDEETTSILKEIESLADKASVYLIDLKPGGLKEDGSTKKFTVNLNCEGQVEQLVDFMYNIEKSDALLKIDEYQITPKAKDSSVARCKISVSTIVVP